MIKRREERKPSRNGGGAERGKKREREKKKGGIHLASVITGERRNWVNGVVKGTELRGSWREWREEAQIELQNKKCRLDERVDVHFSRAQRAS